MKSQIEPPRSTGLAKMLVDQSILGVLMLLAIDTSEPCRWSQYCSCKLLMTSKSAVSANVDASSQPAASSAPDDAPLVMDHVLLYDNEHLKAPHPSFLALRAIVGAAIVGAAHEAVSVARRVGESWPKSGSNILFWFWFRWEPVDVCRYCFFQLVT